MELGEGAAPTYVIYWLSSGNFFQGGKIYCYANFFCYAIVFGPNFRKGQNFSGGQPPAPLWKTASINWGGGQLPNLNKCNSMLTSETRGETLTPNPNEYHSMPMRASRGIYPYPYIHIYSLGIKYDFSTAPLGIGTRTRLLHVLGKTTSLILRRKLGGLPTGGRGLPL